MYISPIKNGDFPAIVIFFCWGCEFDLVRLALETSMALERIVTIVASDVFQTELFSLNNNHLMMEVML